VVKELIIGSMVGACAALVALLPYSSQKVVQKSSLQEVKKSNINANKVSVAPPNVSGSGLELTGEVDKVLGAIVKMPSNLDLGRTNKDVVHYVKDMSIHYGGQLDSGERFHHNLFVYNRDNILYINGVWLPTKQSQFAFELKINLDTKQSKDYVEDKHLNYELLCGDSDCSKLTIKDLGNGTSEIKVYGGYRFETGNITPKDSVEGCSTYNGNASDWSCQFHMDYISDGYYFNKYRLVVPNEVFPTN